MIQLELLQCKLDGQPVVKIATNFIATSGVLCSLSLLSGLFSSAVPRPWPVGCTSPASFSTFFFLSTIPRILLPSFSCYLFGRVL